jgi:hypothetical protein
MNEVIPESNEAFLDLEENLEKNRLAPKNVFANRCAKPIKP